MTKIIISKDAHRDTDDIFLYISARDNREVANKQVENIYRTIAFLENTPNIGMQLKNRLNVDTDYRFLVSGKYLIFYKLTKDKVNIVRIIDGRRDWISLLRF